VTLLEELRALVAVYEAKRPAHRYIPAYVLREILERARDE
jgi:hypothetical protein